LFKSLFVTFILFIDLFAWWHNHDNQFSNVGPFAKYILEISRSQIETKHVFNHANVFKLSNVAFCKWS
jgi:hypothetical protein